MKEFPILEFDVNRKAIIEPGDIFEKIDIPERAVICFFSDVVQKLNNEGKLRLIYNIKTEMGYHPIYEIEYNGLKVAVFSSGVGAPLAAGMLEELIALGSSKFIACGGAGVLDKSVVLGHVIVPNYAIRDEGTSYHYLEPSREVQINKVGIDAIVRVLERHKVKHIIAKTWTTDAIFRETSTKVEQRKLEGCLTVEMECSALCAVAEYRNVLLAQILYGGDVVDCEEWDPRDWNNRAKIREELLNLAIESCLEL